MFAKLSPLGPKTSVAPHRQPFVIAFAVAGPLLLAVSAGNLLDPIVRYDDYPALLAQPDGFWDKTLTEGRWLNYLWHLRGLATPAGVNFALYQLLWATTAAALAAAAVGAYERRWFTVVLALVLLPTPPVFLMAPWASTVIPGLAVLALYAWLALRLSQKHMRLFLPPFTLLAFTAYTTFPIIILTICAVATRKRSLRDLTSLLLLFAASLAASLVLVYTLNWLVHGIFGIQLDPRRSADPAQGLAEMAAHLPLLRETFAVFLQKMTFQSELVLAFHIGLLAVSTAVVAYRKPLEAIYLWTVMALGLALMALQVLKLGFTIPARAFHFAWILYAVLIVRSAQELSQSSNLAGRLARNAVLLVAASYLVQTAVQFTQFRPWQSETRIIARHIQDLPGLVLISGDVRNFPSARKAGVHEASSLASRLNLLTQRDVILCEDHPFRQPPPSVCDTLPAHLRKPKPEAEPNWRIEPFAGGHVILFPPAQGHAVTHPAISSRTAP